MSNSGPDSNGSQFFFTIGEEAAPHLDGRFVAFGQVLSGFEVLAALGSVGRSSDGSTLQRVVVEDCGLLPAGSISEPPSRSAGPNFKRASATAAGEPLARSPAPGPPPARMTATIA